MWCVRVCVGGGGYISDTTVKKDQKHDGVRHSWMLLVLISRT